MKHYQLIYYNNETFFHKSVDVSEKWRTANTFLMEVTDNISKQYVMQVLIDKGAQHKGAGEFLMIRRRFSTLDLVYILKEGCSCS